MIVVQGGGCRCGPVSRTDRPGGGGRVVGTAQVAMNDLLKVAVRYKMRYNDLKERGEAARGAGYKTMAELALLQLCKKHLVTEGTQTKIQNELNKAADRGVEVQKIHCCILEKAMDTVKDAK